MAMFGITISTSKGKRLLATLWAEESKASRVGGACYLPASLKVSATIALTRSANKNTIFKGLSSHIVTRTSQCDFWIESDRLSQCSDMSSKSSGGTSIPSTSILQVAFYFCDIMTPFLALL